MDLIKREGVKQEEDDSSGCRAYELQHKLCLSEEGPYSELSQAVAQTATSPAPSWLFQLCLNNRLPFGSMLDWSSQLLRQLNGQSPSRRPVLLRLQFREFKEKQSYFCLILPLLDGFGAIKVRDRQGRVVYYRQFEREEALAEISCLHRRLPRNSTLLVFDETGEQQHFARLLAAPPLTPNLVYLHPCRYAPEAVEISASFVYREASNYMVCCPKRLVRKVDAFDSIVDQFVATELEDRNSISSLLGPHILVHRDWSCLLGNLLREMFAGPLSPVEDLVASIAQGLNYLRGMVQKYDAVKGRHFPRNGPQKMVCHFCCRRRTRAVCEGCSAIQEQLVYLCVGACFAQHHRGEEELQRGPIGAEERELLEGLDAQYEGIFCSLSHIQGSQSAEESLCEYLRSTNSRIMRAMNEVARRKAVRGRTA